MAETDNEIKQYVLYWHIAPNGKIYIGKTRNYENPNIRWKKGKGYKTQYFNRAINKYGWENFQHLTTYDSADGWTPVLVTEQEANELEKTAIDFYDTSNRDRGYNISKGGDGYLKYDDPNIPKENIKKCSKRWRETHKEYKQESWNKWKENNRERYLNYMHEYNATQREEYKKQRRENYAKNPQKYINWQKEYRASHGDIVRANARKRYYENPQKYREYNKRNRDKNGTTYDKNKVEYQQQTKEHCKSCAYCEYKKANIREFLACSKLNITTRQIVKAYKKYINCEHYTPRGEEQNENEILHHNS